jgi:hypothetical protein
MIRKFSVEVIVVLLIGLFVYTAISKILDADTLTKQMLNQPLPGWFSKTLVWIVPASELIASLLLLIKPLRYYGLIFFIPAFACLYNLCGTHTNAFIQICSVLMRRISTEYVMASSSNLLI